MAQLEGLMQDVWREACRHIEITESVATIAKLIAGRLPVDRLMVCHIDPQHSRIEILADGLAAGDKPRHDEQAQWSADGIEQLLQWCRQGQVELCKAKNRSGQMPRPLLPASLEGEVVVGPLVSEHGIFGLLMMQWRPRHRFTEAHRRLCQALLEPFAVALENDHRLRELGALREAAEADKRSLLARLGRTGLSDTIIGATRGLRPVMERVELVARSDVPVLILGETGSGKEVIARSVHNGSLCNQGPFIRVNCGAIPPELIDSQLFGHEKGRFTGAVSTRRGWFERADEGTLFLDEIGELPLAAQIRLLRVMQDGVFERVGGERPIKVDVRIVAATHRDLAAMVQNGDFREDLWYRIAVFPIVLPPLRERREDIPALAEHFAHRAAERFGLKQPMPSAGDLALLAAYPWPGNVREFGSVIDRAAILGDGERLEVAKALGIAPDAAATSKTNDAAQESAGAGAGATIVSLDAAMKRHIETTLATVGGRIEGPRGAAALLKINPHTLRARMRKLGIQWIAFRAR